MHKNAISVEANFSIKKSKMKGEKRVTIKEEASSSSDVKLDTLIRIVERMVDRMSITKRQLEPQVINPNFRGQQQQPQFRIKQREWRAPEQPAHPYHIQTLLQQNYAQGGEE